MDDRLKAPWLALKYALGAAAFLAGLDKFFNLLANWEMYLSPLAQQFLPIDAGLFMRAIGIIEIVVGIGILTKWTRLASYVAMVWLTCIALNLITTGTFFDVAVRDLEMAVAAFTLARLTEVRISNSAAEPETYFGANAVEAHSR